MSSITCKALSYDGRKLRFRVLGGPSRVANQCLCPRRAVAAQGQAPSTMETLNKRKSRARPSRAPWARFNGRGCLGPVPSCSLQTLSLSKKLGRRADWNCRKRAYETPLPLPLSYPAKGREAKGNKLFRGYKGRSGLRHRDESPAWDDDARATSGGYARLMARLTWRRCGAGSKQILGFSWFRRVL